MPLKLDIHTSASQAELDLRELKVTDLRLDTGASSVDVTLSATGQVTARIKAGAANVKVRVPEGVAACVRSKIGMGTLNLDSARFPLQGGVHQSPDFETAANRVTLDVEAGAATVTII